MPEIKKYGRWIWDDNTLTLLLPTNIVVNLEYVRRKPKERCQSELVRVAAMRGVTARDYVCLKEALAELFPTEVI